MRSRTSFFLIWAGKGAYACRSQGDGRLTDFSNSDKSPFSGVIVARTRSPDGVTIVRAGLNLELLKT